MGSAAALLVWACSSDFDAGDGPENTGGSPGSTDDGSGGSGGSGASGGNSGSGGSDTPAPEDTHFVQSKLPRTSTGASPAALAEATANDTKFAFDLYAQLRGTRGNVFFSPFSISMAFAMAYAGAKGETESEIRNVLLFGDQETTHAAMNALDQAMRSDAPGAVVTFANAYWIRKGLSPLASYLDVLSTNYGAGLGVLDFSRSEEARATINDWVSSKTNAKIPELIPDGAITPSTQTVLTNAAYLKASWQSPFLAASTAPHPFTTQSGDEKTVSMMRQSTHYRYAETADLQLAALPYAGRPGKHYEMIVVLPTSDLATFEPSFDAEALSKALAASSSPLVDLSLPRFSVRSSFLLNEPLEALGMRAPFGGADFSGMSEPPPGRISKVIHEGYVAVDEDGTEAAAATAIIEVDGGVSAEPEPYKTMVVDRPFLLFIRHVETGTILFMGRVSDPS